MNAKEYNYATGRAAGGYPRAALELVQVELSGGSAGDAGSACTFTYDIYRLLGSRTAANRLAVDLTPQRARSSAGQYVAAADGSIGLAYYSISAQEWILLIALDEVAAVTVCDPA